MGNPTSYRGYTFGWRGKQLVSASNGTNSLTFEYNEDGLRQSKTCNNITTDYYYNGSVLIGMQRGQTKYLFSYDAAGNVVSVKHGDDEYYYLRNAQGDIVKLIDESGVTVVEYTYDTWGKKVTTTGSLAGTLGLFQPFRYRGYVYDWETGFYYLQSRYYDPTTGRFISADVLLSTGQGVLGHNAYAYCGDSPVGRLDSTGSFWITALLVTVIVVGGLCTLGCSSCSNEFKYNPSQKNDKDYLMFSNEISGHVLAIDAKNKIPDGCNEDWNKNIEYPADNGIYVYYQSESAERVLNKYAKKWGYEKLASNIAQYGIDKHNDFVKKGKLDRIDWEERKLASEIYEHLMQWVNNELDKPYKSYHNLTN